MLRRTKVTVAVAIAGVGLAAGIVIPLGRARYAVAELELNAVQLRSIEVTRRALLVPTEVRMHLALGVRNPTSTRLDVQRLRYFLEIDGEAVGGGVATDVMLPAHTTVLVPVAGKFAVATLGKRLAEKAKQVMGDFSWRHPVDSLRTALCRIEVGVRVSGSMDVPVHLLGTIRVFTAAHPLLLDCVVKCGD
jgi:hypothetical protein